MIEFFKNLWKTIDELLTLTHHPIDLLILFIGILLGVSLVMIILDYYVHDSIREQKKRSSNDS